MKNFSIILAMLFLAFTVEAQNAERTKRTKDRKSTKTSVRKTSDKSSRTKVANLPSTSRSSASHSVNSSKRSSSNRNTKYSSDSPVTRSSTSRSRKVAGSSTRASKTNASRTRTTRDDAKRAVSSRRVNTESSSRIERSKRPNVVSAQRDRNSYSARANVYTPKTTVRHAASRKVYATNKIHRVKRKASRMYYTHRTLDYRRIHNPYRKPLLSAIYWDARMYRDYRNWYPSFNLWYYPYGYRIHTISAYDSYNYIGEIARIYGRVNEVWYSRESREYYLYIGGPYPYQDFTIIIDSRDAKRFSWDPVRYFTNRHLTVTGLVSLFEDKPEMQIRKRSQISMY